MPESQAVRYDPLHRRGPKGTKPVWGTASPSPSSPTACGTLGRVDNRHAERGVSFPPSTQLTSSFCGCTSRGGLPTAPQCSPTYLCFAWDALLFLSAGILLQRTESCSHTLFLEPLTAPHSAGSPYPFCSLGKHKVFLRESCGGGQLQAAGDPASGEAHWDPEPV